MRKRKSAARGRPVGSGAQMLALGASAAPIRMLRGSTPPFPASEARSTLLSPPPLNRALPAIASLCTPACCSPCTRALQSSGGSSSGPRLAAGKQLPVLALAASAGYWGSGAKRTSSRRRAPRRSARAVKSCDISRRSLSPHLAWARRHLRRRELLPLLMLRWFPQRHRRGTVRHLSAGASSQVCRVDHRVRSAGVGASKQGPLLAAQSGRPAPRMRRLDGRERAAAAAA